MRRGTSRQLVDHQSETGSEDQEWRSDGQGTRVFQWVRGRAMDPARGDITTDTRQVDRSGARAQNARSSGRGTSNRLATSHSHRHMRDEALDYRGMRSGASGIDDSSAPIDRGINKRISKQTQFIKASSLGNLYQVMELGIASVVHSVNDSE